MKYIVTNCRLPEDLISPRSRERFESLLKKAASRNIDWSYSFGKGTLVICNAPSTLAGKLADYGDVKEEPDNA